MKRILIIFIIFFLISLSVLSSKTMIFYVAHPDDESIAMADQIVRGINDGYKVIIAVLTNGANVDSVQHYLLSKEEITTIREKQLRNAVRILGVEEENIFFYRFEDEHLTINDAFKVMIDLNKRYPLAVQYTVSVYDEHPDHQALARALYKYCREIEPNLEIAFYRVYLHLDFLKVGRLPNTVEAIPLKYPTKRREAIASYKNYNPQSGVYSIGYDADPDLFQAAISSEHEYRDILNYQTKILLRYERSQLIGFLVAFLLGVMLLGLYFIVRRVKQRR